MDVKIVFLNGNLEEEVYIIQPEGYASKEFPQKVCSLQRSIYGLKETSKSWNMIFDEAIRKIMTLLKMKTNLVCTRR